MALNVSSLTSERPVCLVVSTLGSGSSGLGRSTAVSYALRSRHLDRHPTLLPTWRDALRDDPNGCEGDLRHCVAFLGKTHYSHGGPPPKRNNGLNSRGGGLTLLCTSISSRGGTLF